jgi:hypothetical protein
MIVRTSLAALLAVSTLQAQNDFNWDKASSNRLGTNLTMEIAGAPANSIVLVIPSFNQGPFPLIFADGVDTRSLEVGIELAGLAGIAVTQPDGTGSYSLFYPNDPTWNDIRLYWQCGIVPFSGPTLFSELSNSIFVQSGLPDTPVAGPTSLTSARAFAASFFDTNNNAGMGDVLITGGGAGQLTNATGLATTELYDYRLMKRKPGPTMTSSRATHVAVPLLDGRVLLIGGANSSGAILNSCEIYNPATNSFSATNPMSTPRMLHAACRLADGRVMVAGGVSALDPANLVLTALNSVEIWNPATGTWSGANPIGGTRAAVALTLLSNGQVMVSGGIQVSYLFGVPVGANSVNTVQRWNPATGTWTSGQNMPTARAGHHWNQVTLNDGRVLMSGGINAPDITSLINMTASPLDKAELYNPATNTWLVANMPIARALHTASLLPNGRVAVCGGAQGTLGTPISIANVHTFNPATNTWAAAPSLIDARAGHNAALTPDGTLVLFGGQGTSSTLTTIETIRY